VDPAETTRRLRLDCDVPAAAEYYRRSEHWPRTSIDRYKMVVVGGEAR